MGILTPTIPTLIVSGISAAIAVQSMEAAALGGSQSLFLAAAVAAGTFLAAKVGRVMGGWLGLLGGATGGAVTGGLLGRLLSGNSDGATGGAAAGGVTFGVLLGIAGALTGYFGGAVLGHQVTKAATIDIMQPQGLKQPALGEQYKLTPQPSIQP